MGGYEGEHWEIELRAEAHRHPDVTLDYMG